MLHIIFYKDFKTTYFPFGKYRLTLHCIFWKNSNMRQEAADKNIMSLYSPAHSLYVHKYTVISLLSSLTRFIDINVRTHTLVDKGNKPKLTGHHRLLLDDVKNTSVVFIMWFLNLKDTHYLYMLHLHTFSNSPS